MLREKAIEKSLKWRGTPIGVTVPRKTPYTLEQTYGIRCATRVFCRQFQKPGKSTRSGKSRKILITFYRRFGFDKMEVPPTRGLWTSTGRTVDRIHCSISPR